MLPGTHVWQLTLALALALGPVPASLACVTASAEKENLSLSRNWLIFLVWWCLLGSAVGLLLGMAGRFSLEWALLAMGLLFFFGCGWLAANHHRRPVRTLFFPTVPPSTGEMLLLGMAAALGFALFVHLTTRVVIDHDSLAYHLPTMFQWYQTHSVAREVASARLNDLFPYAWEMLCALFLLPFQDDFLSLLPNLAAWVMFGLAIYCLAREIGATRAAGAALALVALSLPDILENVGTLHIDLPFAALFLTGLLFTLLYPRTRARSDLGLWCAAIGFLAGIKTSGLVYGGLLCGLLLGSLLWRRFFPTPQPSRHRGATSVFVVGLLCAVLVGGFWYVRNYIEFHNPLTPLTVRIGSQVIFPGLTTLERIAPTTIAGLFNPRDLVDWNTLLTEISEHLGTQFYVMLGLAVLGFIALLRRPAPAGRAALGGWFGLVIVTAYLYATTPYSADQLGRHPQITAWSGQALRYAFPCCGILAVTAALGATLARLPRWALFGGSLYLALGALSDMDMLVVMAIPVALWGAHLLLTPSRPTLSFWDTRRLAYLLCVCLPLVWFGTHSARMWRTSQREYTYGLLDTVLPTVVAPGETIGHIKCSNLAVLYGPTLAQQIQCLPLSLKNAWEWRRYLQDHHITVIAVGPVRPPSADWEFAQWFGSETGPCDRIYGDPTTEIALYHVKETVAPLQARLLFRLYQSKTSPYLYRH